MIQPWSLAQRQTLTNIAKPFKGVKGSTVGSTGRSMLSHMDQCIHLRSLMLIPKSFGYVLSPSTHKLLPYRCPLCVSLYLPFCISTCFHFYSITTVNIIYPFILCLSLQRSSSLPPPLSSFSNMASFVCSLFHFVQKSHNRRINLGRKR